MIINSPVNRLIQLGLNPKYFGFIYLRYIVEEYTVRDVYFTPGCDFFKKVAKRFGISTQAVEKGLYTITCKLYDLPRIRYNTLCSSYRLVNPMQMEFAILVYTLVWRDRIATYIFP